MLLTSLMNSLKLLTALCAVLNLCCGNAQPDERLDAVDADATNAAEARAGGLGLLKCPNRPGGRSQVDVKLKVDQYKGVQHGRNGDHEIFEGTIVTTYAASNQTAIDTQNVHVAMNIKTSGNPEGLPREIPLSVGATVQMVGEYIPAEQANATNSKGKAAVLHFTHSPCGEVLINGTLYQ